MHSISVEDPLTVGRIGPECVDQAYITTITNHTYLKGLRVLIKSLKKRRQRFRFMLCFPWTWRLDYSKMFLR